MCDAAADPVQPRNKIITNVPRAHVRLDLDKAFANPQNSIDQQAVGGTLDLEVAEEGVCAEEAEDLVQGIVGLGVRVGREVSG